ncbi:MAG TPA: GNAT family N-acetyltransferase [Candidatus Limnocylindria bacterium]|nr:GNAT family N-acetyltransferase [Candidatus Limnocylindria bacterium]
MASTAPPLPRLRRMRPDDVDAATEMVLGHGWGVRREWLAFAASQAACTPLIAEFDRAVVATGVGTANGPVGWIGSIFVDPAFRGRGLGRAITQGIIDALDSAGCRTLVLVATSEGRRLYEPMGFQVQTHYRILEAPGLAAPDEPDEPAAPSIRPFHSDDLPGLVALDRAATGEDRVHALNRLAVAATAKVAVGADGEISGFLVRPPWGGGATVARSIEDALTIVRARRVTSGLDGRVRVGVLQENREGLERLGFEGFRQAWSAPRMLRGEPLSWRPELIWGQFNHAMG